MVELQLEKPSFFEYLGYQPHDGQQSMHDSTALRRVLCCGTRWGKSTAAAMEVAAALMEPRGSSTGWVVAPTFDLANRVFEPVRALVHKHLAHRIIEDCPREHRLVLRNLGGGVSEARAKSAEQARSLLGAGLDWVVLDEAARLKRDVWEGHLSPRLLDRNGWALIISTPRGMDWFFEAFRRGQRTTDPDFDSWRAPSWSNPHLDPAVIEAERSRLPAEVFSQELGAEFVGAESMPCEECGGPDRTAIGIAVLLEGEELGTCAECGRRVDGSGRTVVGRWPDGREHLVIVRLVLPELESA